VTRVELSLDGGAAWRSAAVEPVEPPTKHGMHWAWVWWRLAIPTADLAAAREVRLRAADSSMNTQPAELTWSLLGMMGNQHYKLKLHVHTRAEDGALCLRVQHPAPLEAGPLGNVGWREEDAAAAAAATDGPATPPPSEAALARAASGRGVTAAELAKHTEEDSVWFAYRGRVYDGTAFLDAHPGGADSILIVGGQDATADFDAIHSAKAKAMLDEYLVGDLVEGGEEEEEEAADATRDGAAAAAAVPAVFLDPRRKLPLPLQSKTVLSPNTRLLRFALPTPSTVLGLPVGKHIFLYGAAPHAGSAGTREVMRAYTPITADADVGHVDFVIKVYDDSLGGGVMSRWLDSLAVGDTVDAKGPVGHFVYGGAGACALNRRSVSATHMTFVAAGTGITPCYAVIRAALAEAKGADGGVALKLVYANRTEDDVLLAAELDALAAGSGGRFAVTYTLSRPGPAWPHRAGRIDAAMLADEVPPPGPGRLVLLCGPHALVDDVCVPALVEMGYGEESVVRF
jgi:nitrate reductase (NAD(P)H)